MKDEKRFRKDYQLWKACAKKGDKREQLEYVEGTPMQAMDISLQK